MCIPEKINILKSRGTLRRFVVRRFIRAKGEQNESSHKKHNYS